MELNEETPNTVPSSAGELRTRIAATARRVGVRKDAYKAANVSSATLQRYIAGTTAPTFDAMAHLCAAANVRLDWLATGEGPMLRADTPEPAPDSDSQNMRLDEAKLAEALTTIDQALALTRRSAPPQARARLAVMAYRILVEEDSVSAALSRIIQAVDAATTGDTT